MWLLGALLICASLALNVIGVLALRRMSQNKWMTLSTICRSIRLGDVLVWINEEGEARPVNLSCPACREFFTQLLDSDEFVVQADESTAVLHVHH